MVTQPGDREHRLRLQHPPDFEPLDEEAVMAIIHEEHASGVVVQFGGQTAINLAEPLDHAGVTILGSSIASIDLAEDRRAFEP